jgi:hypothetical protein
VSRCHRRSEPDHSSAPPHALSANERTQVIQLTRIIEDITDGAVPGRFRLRLASLRDYVKSQPVGGCDHVNAA